MSATCPYCNADVEINHDDGYECSEDQAFQQECHACFKTFAYTTSIHFYYRTKAAPCLNGASHKLRESTTYPKRYARMYCEWCGHDEPLSKERLQQILDEEKAKP